jgi:hypothetical protein
MTGDICAVAAVPGGDGGLRRKRLTIDIWRDGTFDQEWANCYASRDEIPAIARALFPVRKQFRFPKLRQQKLSQRKRRAYAELGMDPDAAYYQIASWHDPAKCLAHLRRHLPGLHVISPEEHDAVAAARREAEGLAP